MTLSRARVALAIALFGVASALLVARNIVDPPFSQQPSSVSSLSSRDAVAGQPSGASPRWFKGNTHTHTINSDGDSTPDEVVRWYREHGYHFLVLTDHNYLTDVAGVNAVHGARDQFVVLPGEEVTSRAGDKPIHVNGLAVETLVQPHNSPSVLDVLQRNVDGIRQARGVPHINHPNYGWAIGTDDLRQLERTRLFEIFNGHPQVNNLGGGGAPGLEQMWDVVLTSGRMLYGIAVDDAHYFKRPGDMSVPGPGRGWVFVRADRLEPRLLLDALERGDFYASTGVELTSYEASRVAITIAIKADAWSKYRVQFIGRGGRLLDEQVTPTARYAFRGDEGYVRARITESNGRQAWTQPVAVGSSAPK
jgi:hypothetical protein